MFNNEQSFEVDIDGNLIVNAFGNRYVLVNPYITQVDFNMVEPYSISFHDTSIRMPSMAAPIPKFSISCSYCEILPQSKRFAPNSQNFNINLWNGVFTN